MTRLTKPRYVITNNGAGLAWNAKAKAFGPWREATRYKDQNAADSASEHIPGAVGIFPLSTPRPY